jgi:hypothetical protein
MRSAIGLMVKGSEKARRQVGTSRIETAIGVTILGVLAVIAAAILVKQAHYDPKVIRPALVVQGEVSPGPSASESLPMASNQGAEEGVVASAPEAMLTAEVGAQGSGAPSRLPNIFAKFSPPRGITRAGTAEQFDAATLSDKIDGRAEFYLDLGFEALQCQRFAPEDSNDKGFEAFVLCMTSPLAAFAAWSNQRRPDARADTTLPFAYVTANAYYFVKGSYYVELVSPWAQFGTWEGTRRFAQALHDAIETGATDSDVLSLLPAENRVRGSERLILKDAFGFSKLDKVLQADYVIEGTTVTLWLSPRANEQEARELARAYHEFVTRELGADDATAQLGASSGEMRAANALGDYEVVCAWGTKLVGVRGAKSLAFAKSFLEKIIGGARR